MKYWFSLLSGLLLLGFESHCQNYKAVQGSVWAGSLGISNNPASISSTPCRWDITLLGGQLTTSTNAIKFTNFSYLHNRDTIGYYFPGGKFSRFLDLNFNLHLLNVRITLNRRTSFAFGANLRSYSNLSTSPYQFVDTIKGSGEFFKMNGDNNKNLSLNFYHSSWIELFGTYSRTLIDDPVSRLNAGATLVLSRGISGAFASLRNLDFTGSAQNGVPGYNVTNAVLHYGYSSNYDHWQKGNARASNLNNFLAYTEGGISFDLGMEYLLKKQEIRSVFDEDDYYDYSWKFGAALLDAGINQYKYGVESRSAAGIKGSLTNQRLDSTFGPSTHHLPTFNDSLATLVSSGTPSGKFSVINPMRLVLNADHAFANDFYFNMELSLNLPSGMLKKYFRVNDINLLTLTPRWETRRWGFYLPIQVNNNSQFWIGGALKAGPLLLGVHNLANIFSKTKSANGGGYLAIVIRSPRNTEGKRDKRLDCPGSTR